MESKDPAYVVIVQHQRRLKKTQTQNQKQTFFFVKNFHVKHEEVMVKDCKHAQTEQTCSAQSPDTTLYTYIQALRINTTHSLTHVALAT